MEQNASTTSSKRIESKLTFVTNIVPQTVVSLAGIRPGQKATGGSLVSPETDDFGRDFGLGKARGGGVLALELFHHDAKLDVPRVGCGVASSSTEDIYSIISHQFSVV